MVKYSKAAFAVSADGSFCLILLLELFLVLVCELVVYAYGFSLCGGV